MTTARTRRCSRTLFRRAALLVAASAALVGCRTAADAPLPDPDGFNSFVADDLAPTCSVQIDAERELLVRDPAVVDDPVRTRWSGSFADPSDGAWHFGRLLAAMAGSRDPAAFTRQWLANWESDQLVNGFTVAARPAIRATILDAWPKLADGRLDLTRAPFRLLAIVDRLDLGNADRGSAGEGRFVFGALGPGGEALQFTVILEYDLVAPTTADALAWARDWHALGSLSGAEYNRALQAITDRFAGRNAAPARPNGSALNQIRTNEIALATTWEMREFFLTRTSSNLTGRLRQRTLALTPDRSFNGSDRLSRFVNGERVRILNHSPVVPRLFEVDPDGVRQPFRGGAVRYPRTDVWRAGPATPIDVPEARHLFSMNTCNGCHAGETRTRFTHVFPRESGAPARLSGFLTGIEVPDPATGEVRRFADLERRAVELKNLICAPQAALLQQPNERSH